MLQIKLFYYIFALGTALKPLEAFGAELLAQIAQNNNTKERNKFFQYLSVLLYLKT